jgi:predicted ATP-dependent protease
LGNDAAHFLHRTGGSILVGRPQARAQQLVAREDIQRQIAVAAVVAVEEALRLMAVKRNVGGVQVQHDLFRRTAM